MAAGIYNLSIEQGSSWELSLSVDSPGGIDKNLIGYTFSGKIAKSYYDDNPISFTTSNVDLSAGTFKISLPANITALLDSSYEYVYDVEMTSNTGVVTRLIQGRATISPGVT